MTYYIFPLDTGLSQASSLCIPKRGIQVLSPRLCLFSCPPLLPVLLTRTSQEEQGPPGANAAWPWQCRELCPVCCLYNDDLAGSNWGLTSELLLSSGNAGFFSFKELPWGVLISVALTELFFLFHCCPMFPLPWPLHALWLVKLWFLSYLSTM